VAGSRLRRKRGHEADAGIAGKAEVRPDPRTLGWHQQLDLIDVLIHTMVIVVAEPNMSVLAGSLPIRAGPAARWRSTGPFRR
jgi:hypothetical protein